MTLGPLRSWRSQRGTVTSTAWAVARFTTVTRPILIDCGPGLLARVLEVRLHLIGLALIASALVVRDLTDRCLGLPDQMLSLVLGSVHTAHGVSSSVPARIDRMMTSLLLSCRWRSRSLKQRACAACARPCAPSSWYRRRRRRRQNGFSWPSSSLSSSIRRPDALVSAATSTSRHG